MKAVSTSFSFAIEEGRPQNAGPSRVATLLLAGTCLTWSSVGANLISCRDRIRWGSTHCSRRCGARTQQASVTKSSRSKVVARSLQLNTIQSALSSWPPAPAQSICLLRLKGGCGCSSIAGGSLKRRLLWCSLLWMPSSDKFWNYCSRLWASGIAAGCLTLLVAS